MEQTPKQPVLEKVAKASGNSAHVYVPSEWEGDLIRIKRVAPARPPLFETVTEDETVRVEYLGGGGEERSVEGTVEKMQLNLRDDDTATFTVVLDADDGKWRLVASRPKDGAEWDEEYRVRSQVRETYSMEDSDMTEITDDDPESDDYVELGAAAEDGLMGYVDWETVGVVKSLAVKQQVDI